MAYGGHDHEEPYGGDHWLEHCDYELGARYDYLREAYGDMVVDYDEIEDPLDELQCLAAAFYQLGAHFEREAKAVQRALDNDDIPF